MDVCILTAGRGTRLGESARDLNKGLLPLGQKAALSHLIERFPAGTRFVVAVGHLADQVEEYLGLAHPGVQLELVRVEPFEGPGSGPGTSVLRCELKLPRPFFLVCSDTYWSQDEPLAHSPSGDVAWVGFVPPHERHEYCNLLSDGGRVVSIHDKTAPPAGAEAWIGLAFIQDRERFFSGIRAGGGVQGEVQLSAGLGALARAGTLQSRRLPGWRDLGTADRYLKARIELGEGGFEKSGERFYRVGDRVLKFFSDPMIVRNRVERARLKPRLFPELLGHGRWFLSYRYVEGETLRDRPDPDHLRDLLSWLSREVWSRPAEATPEFRQLCLAFYRAKTESRLARLEQLGGSVDGVPVPDARTVLAAVPWDALGEGRPSFIHGDLQLDNVVRCADPSEGAFRLIDWRQDFAGSLELGDLSYDFAKLLASIELDFRAVARGEFHVAATDGGFKLVAPPLPGAERLRSLVEEAAVRQHGLHPPRLRALTGLVYLNMAGLHTGEESRLLYHLGRKRLFESLAELPRQAQPARAATWRSRS